MVHKFDPEKWQRLDTPERRAVLPPDKVLDDIGLRAGQTMVDVGCGAGYFAIPAADRVGSKGKVYAVDIAADMLARVADQVADEIGNEEPPIVLVHSEETSIPLPDGVADHVFTCAVFHEIAPEDRTAFLTELTRLLKPDGVITIVDWAPVQEVTMGPPAHERLPLDVVEAAVLDVDGLRMKRHTMIGPHYYLVQAERADQRQ